MHSNFSFLVYRFYQFLMWIFWPFISLYLLVRLTRGKESGSRFFERFGFSKKQRPEGPLIWIHAASVGESLAVLPLIELLLNRDSCLHILITTGTTTSAQLIEKRLPLRAFHQYIPIDHPFCVSLFLKRWSPSCVMWLESELWPIFLRSIKKKKIPSILMNARMSDASYKRWRRSAGIGRFLLKQFDLCLAQSTEMALRLRTLGAAHVRVPGNLKFASAPLPVKEEELQFLEKKTAKRLLLLGASTHFDEENIIGRFHVRLKGSFPTLLTIIVPRHPHRGKAICESLKNKKGLQVVCRSEGEEITPDTDIYIADTLGELGLFYRLCPIILMGGSFVSVGGHNPIEPAFLGCALLFGPHMENFSEIAKKFETQEAAFWVKNEEEAVQKIKFLLENPEACFDLAHRAEKAAKSECAVLERIMEDILPFLPPLLPTVEASENDGEG